jgi:peptide alpha-N-acetyltransferase
MSSTIGYRPFLASDIPEVQECNIKCLPENYQFKYYLYHYITWPRCSWVALFDGKVVGYVLVKLEEEPSKLPWGHITSLAVLLPYRGRRIAENLMKCAEVSLFHFYKVTTITLHVRVSNVAANKLYQEKLGFKIEMVDEKYYADGEDAFKMKKVLQ